MKYYILVLALLTGTTTVVGQNTKSSIITSPDGKISFSISVREQKLLYTLAYRSKTVIEESQLGLLVNNVAIAENVSGIDKLVKQKVNETYAYRSVHNKAINKYTAAKFYVNAAKSFQLEARVFNDGVAFRYIINNKDASIVEEDNTQFVIPPGTAIWSQPNVKYYEGKYSQQLIDTIKQGFLIGPPVTMVLANNAGYVAITEGGLTNFAGMSIIAKGNRVLQANLLNRTTLLGTIETAWRIIEIGEDLNTLVNCDIIANVSPAYDKKLFPQGYNTGWIKPGRSVWSWLAKTRSVTLQNMKQFSDLAAKLGFEYNLVDEGWSDWKDSANGKDQWDMMKELVDYSATKGVKIWVWKAYPDRKGIPGIKDPEQRKAFFKKCKDIGIVGLKVDFFDNEAQEIIQFYQAALKDAAEYKLMLNFHGANKPTGETRTWPNEMTREAIRGMENRPPWGASNTILPFTRYLAGHADFTPLHFGDRLGEVTWAHHIASMIIFTSPLLCVGADPQSILDNPCKEMIRSIPPVWDETIVLPQSKIGELVLYARRKGTTWFLAAMSSSNEIKSIAIDCSFLEGDYLLSSVSDDKDKQNNALLEKQNVSNAATVTIMLNANGGYAGRFVKTK